jgi:hypothetical protein
VRNKAGDQSSGKVALFKGNRRNQLLACIDANQHLRRFRSLANARQLYQSPKPICDIPDRGMMLAPRWESETPITLVSSAPMLLHGSAEFEI